jgi:hypothetical protein
VIADPEGTESFTFTRHIFKLETYGFYRVTIDGVRFILERPSNGAVTVTTDGIDNVPRLPPVNLNLERNCYYRQITFRLRERNANRSIITVEHASIADQSEPLLSISTPSGSSNSFQDMHDRIRDEVHQTLGIPAGLVTPPDPDVPRMDQEHSIQVFDFSNIKPRDLVIVRTRTRPDRNSVMKIQNELTKSGLPASHPVLFLEAEETLEIVSEVDMNKLGYYSLTKVVKEAMDTPDEDVDDESES